MILSAVLLSCFATFGNGLMFYLNPGQAKCFSDEFAYDVLVAGDYRVVTPNQDTKALKLTVNKKLSLLFVIYFF